MKRSKLDCRELCRPGKPPNSPELFRGSDTLPDLGGMPQHQTLARSGSVPTAPIAQHPR